MKKRNSFVSNSSSSSFILYDWGAFTYFKITKQDLIDAFTHLLGEDYVKNYRGERKKDMEEHQDWWEDDRKYDNIGPFYIYDMYDPKDKKEAFERWGMLLDAWDCRHSTIDDNGKIQYQYMMNEYEKAIETLGKIYGIVGDINHRYGNEKPTMWIKTEKKQKNGCYGYNVAVPNYLIKIYKDIRKKCNIKTNKDILKHELSRYFFHFDDNELWQGEGSIPSKNDELIDADPNDAEDMKKYYIKRNEEIKNSPYISKSYTMQRVAEMLFKYFVDIGKINPDDEKLLKKMYPITKEMKKYFKDDKDAKYNTDNRKNLSYKDLEENFLAFVGHEG